MMKVWKLADFIRESNMIEGINRDPTPSELEVMEDFLTLPMVTVGCLEKLVAILQPGAVLRGKPGLDVRVGSFHPPKGGPEIKRRLADLVYWANKGNDYRRQDAYDLHLQYETLHPFTDGNGRSGRALWLWMVGGVPVAQLGFLHQFYYDTLAAQSGR